MSKKVIKKSLTVQNLMATKHDVFEFDGEWKEFLNQPESKGVWFIWGASGSGKSSFVMLLAKYLARFDKVLYNALEEYGAKSFKDRGIRIGIQEVKRNFLIVKYTLEELTIVLRRRKSPKVVIIDSEKYMKWRWDDYLKLIEEFPTKTFIIIGQAKGKNPSTQLSIDIQFDSYIKIWVEGYTAFSKGREIGPNGGVYTIWDEGAEKYWSDKPQNQSA